MDIVRHSSVKTDLKNLKRFPAAEESLEAWERLFDLKGLKETPGINEIPGFSNLKIYKARIVPLKENIGKSKGYRAVFQLLPDNTCRILFFSRHGIYKTERELLQLVKQRLFN